jgi:hypothetical protein
MMKIEAEMEAYRIAKKEAKIKAAVLYFISIVGIGMLVGAFIVYKDTSSFIAGAAKAEGTVVDLVKVTSRQAISYKPTVHFIDHNGQTIEFTSSASSKPPSYSKGQKVNVFYNPTKSQIAEIEGFFTLWGGSVLLGIFGGVLLMIGGGIILAGVLKNNKNENLKKNGTPIDTELQSVERMTTSQDNGMYPFIISTKWQNPTTSELHIFQSDNIWFDPTSYVECKRITVFIEKGNPKKYYVDLSFLPTQ